MKTEDEINSALEIMLAAVKGAELAGRKHAATTNAGMAMALAWVLEFEGVTRRFDNMLDECRAIKKGRGHRHD